MPNLRPEFENDAERQQYREEMQELIEGIYEAVRQMDPRVDPLNYYQLMSLHPGYQYYGLLSGRNRAKTDGAIEFCLVDALSRGREVAYTRRRQSSFTEAGKDLMSDLMSTSVTPDHRNFIEHATRGKANEIRYKVRAYWLVYNDPDTGKRTWDDEPVIRTAAVSLGDDTIKGIQWPRVLHIISDEIIAEPLDNGLSPYITNEGRRYINLLSSIIRAKRDVTIWMLGNTVNKDCPILQTMGLRHYGQMQPGDLQSYTSRTTKGETRILLHHLAAPNTRGIPIEETSGKYFCFDDPEVAVVTEGGWSTADYPHAPEGHHIQNYRAEFFVLYRDEVLHCHVCYANGVPPYLFIHLKTSPMSEEQKNKALIYSEKMDIRPNWRRKITKPFYDREKKIYEIFMQDRVYYADNYCGELLRNYIGWCRNGG